MNQTRIYDNFRIIVNSHRPQSDYLRMHHFYSPQIQVNSVMGNNQALAISPNFLYDIKNTLSRTKG